MKKILTYILTLIAFSTALVSCADDYFNDSQAADGKVSLRLILSFPSSESQTRTTDRPESMESATDNLHVLIFENGSLQEEVKNITITSSNASNGTKTLNAITEKSYKNQIEVAILTNVGKERGEFNGSQYLGASKASIYKPLTYKYPSAWDITKQAIPMWGAISLTPKNPNNVSIGLYRALAKMNVYDKQAEGDKRFTLTSVRVYYSYNEGYSTPLVEPTASNPVLLPSIIEGSNRFDVTKPLVYTNAEGTTAFENLIYVPEANNESRTKDEKALCLVVGGKYTGAGLVGSNKDSYYRIDLKDKEKTPYDVLRNHLYNFNINSVSSPGTPTPEEALENAVVGMDVTIEEWDETTLRSIADQYSLTTDKSRVSFEQKGGSETVTVWSDFGEPWEVVEKSDSWFECIDEKNGKITLNTESNFGASRTGYFYIQVGQLKKQIIVEQLQLGTANAYVVGGGEHEISVIVKGNGTQGLYADDKNGTRVQLDETAILETHHLSIIWETKKGLVQLKDHNSGSYVSEGATYDTGNGKLKYNVTLTGASIGGTEGGNALIGAFDQNDRLIWSWHIWVCPEMAKDGYQDQDWTLTGYEVMDRNLGALSNEPGVASLGLLYQWGRKDPFIGAAAIKDDSDVLPTENYKALHSDHKWGVEAATGKGVAYTIENPTKLIHEGLSVTETSKGAYLWGTNGGLNKENIKDLGTKTIYDPCPIGYRVPPVDAFVFKGTVVYEDQFGGTSNFEESDIVNVVHSRGETQEISAIMFNVPITGALWVKETVDGTEKFYSNGITIKKGETRWVTRRFSKYTLRKSSEDKNWAENLIYIPHKLKTAIQWEKEDLLYYKNGDYQQGADYYGYYMNYKEVKEPEVEDMYYLKPKQSNLTWIPLSGAYNPEKGFGFKNVIVQKGPSLTVNSFLWTNSSIKSTDDITRPAALFLHGAEISGGTDGRHIHGLNKDDIKAEPHYAGAIRCVRDTKKDFSADNKVPGDINFDSTGGTAVGTVYAINDTWRVTDPGAPWFRITPDQAGADKNKGTTISFIASPNTTGSERSATVKIKFSGETGSRTVKVTQPANN